MIQLSAVKIPLSHDETLLRQLAAKRLRLPDEVIRSLRIAKKSVDARDKTDVHFVMTLLAELQEPADEPKAVAEARSPFVTLHTQKDVPPPPPFTGEVRPVVVGLGPAGLLAALTLARAGAKPLVLERGKPVEQRAADVEAFLATGKLDPASNTLFGEGGAGTFSDGKLTTGIKSPYIPGILRDFAKAGAPEEILYAAKPHIGTDRLRVMVKNLRLQIEELGGEVRFGTAMTGLKQQGGRLCGITARTDSGAEEVIPCDTVFLAVGHSARDVFAFLREAGIPLEQKPFSMGVRIEHPQALISQSQYGEATAHPALGAADYKLSCHLPGGRSAYTFCMCPGGLVVPAASEEGGLNINGMSLYARDGENANSALLINVEPADFGGDDPLAGVRFQQKWEQKAYRAGGGGFIAPAQRVADLMQGAASTALGGVKPSYRPGVVPADLRTCLPEFVSASLVRALPLMNNQLKGFAMGDAVLTGIECRSSSPVRVLRDPATLCSPAAQGLYPLGEGAGYAGGILSAAADGVRAAYAYLAAQQKG